MDTPMLSIIVPVYNSEKYIALCIESILNQSNKNYELILIDDGSTDASGIICDKFSRVNNNIRVYHNANNGVGISRNIGISYAKGKYITFVDSDDWLAVNYVEKILYNIEGRDILFFSNNRCFENGNIIGQYHAYIDCKNLEETENLIYSLKFQESKQYEYYGFTWNKCFRSDIIKKYDIRFIKGLSIREDEVFTNEYCRHIKTLRFINDALYNYRETLTGLTYKKHNENEYLLLCRFLDITTDGIKKRNLLSCEKKRILSFYLFYIKSYNLNTFKIIYDFYKNNSTYIKGNDLKSIAFFRLPLLFSYISFVTFKLLKSLIHK